MKVLTVDFLTENLMVCVHAMTPHGLTEGLFVGTTLCFEEGAPLIDGRADGSLDTEGL